MVRAIPEPVIPDRKRSANLDMRHRDTRPAVVGFVPVRTAPDCRRPRFVTILMIALGLCIPHNAVTAQGQASMPEPGTRVRVTVPCEPTATSGRPTPSASCSVAGDFVLARADSLALFVNGSTLRYGLDVLRKVEVSRGYRSYRPLGGAVGFVVGAVATYFVIYSGGSTSLCDQSANQDATSRGACVGLIALGGAAGAGLGVVIGGLFHSERWQAIPLQRLRVGLAPVESSGLVVRLTF